MWTSDRLRPRSSHMAKVLRRCEPPLADQLDDAATVLASAQARIPALLAGLTVPCEAARGHLEDILPIAAVYLELRDRVGQDRARQLTGACLDSGAERMARVLRLVDRTPWLFPIFRRTGRWMMQRSFTPPVFAVRWIEDSPQRVQFDMTRCYYLDTLTALGIPELTPVFCHGDEVMYDGLKHLRFVRAGTLGQGCDRCDFCFERLLAREQHSLQRAAP